MHPDPEADSCDFRLLIMKADGTGIRRLASSWEFYDPQPLRWSPDGKSLLMACGDRICVVDPTADRPPVPVSSPRTAEADWEASWSPDGRQIAFVRRYPNFCCPPVQPWSQLWVANADGSEPVLIGGGPGQELFTSPAWSPDGRLAYVRDYDDVWVSRADWTGARPIAQDLSGLLGIAGWSPDAATLYGGTSSGLWAIAADGARQALYRLTGGPMSVHAVSPAGRVGFVDGGRGPQTLRIAEVSFDSAREGVVATAMSPQALAWTTFSFSPDGSQIAYASDGECPTLIGLHVVRVDGGASPSVGDRREC